MSGVTYFDKGCEECCWSFA